MADRRAALYHSLAVALQAGLPVTRALDSMVCGARGHYRKAWTDVLSFVKAGNTVAEAMARHPRAFAPFDILVVEVAERSGYLPESMQQLAGWYGLRIRLKRIIGSGMLLPALLIHAAAVIIPFPSLILGGRTFGGFGGAVVSTLAWFYIPIGAILAVVYLTPRSGLPRRFLDTLLLKIPVLGGGIRQLALSRYCQGFTILCKAGVPATESARRAAQVTGNSAVAGLLAGGAESALSGRPISDGFSRRLPRGFIEAWQVAEETGDLDEVSRRLGEGHAERAEHALTEFCRWLPRLVYFVVCLYLIRSIFAAWGGIPGVGR